jgi:hypothetical protein
LIPVSAAAAPKTLEIGQGTVEIGGYATANLYFVDIGDGFSFDIAPEAGFFVSDQVELVGLLDFFWVNGNMDLRLEVGAEYFFPSEYIRPYVGGTVGFGSYPYVGVIGDEVATLSGVGGVVLPLNRNVGIDLGGRLVVLLDDSEVALHIPIGMVGVRAFFP